VLHRLSPTTYGSLEACVYPGRFAWRALTMSNEQPLRDSVRPFLSHYAAEDILVVLEGMTRTAALSVLALLLSIALPTMALLLGASYVGHQTVSVLQIVGVSAFVFGAPVLVYSLLRRDPSDAVIARDGLHLFWEGTRVPHRFIPWREVREVRFPTGMTGGLPDTVIVEPRQGSRCSIRLIGYGRFGPVRAFKVVHNATGIAFDDKTPVLEIPKAFRELLRSFAPEKVR